MTRITALFLGIFGAFVLSWAGLILIPNYQIGHLDPQTDEDGNDPYPAPKSGMAERGRHVYAANGCVYCHSQQVRADYAGSDIERKWGDRRSAPRDYIFERPVELGKMRMGPDLANIGKRTPVEPESAAGGASPAQSGTPVPQVATTNPSPAGASPANAAAAASPAATPAALAASDAEDMLPRYSEAWHHRHLYSPRSLVRDSNMPSYRFLYEKRKVSGERAVDALKFEDKNEMTGDWEVVPTYDAKCLVAYLMSLNQSHPLKEVPGQPSASSPAAAPKGK